MFNLTRREMVHVPIIGQVAAGEPILAQENIEDYWPVPADRMPNKQTFFKGKRRKYDQCRYT